MRSLPASRALLNAHSTCRPRHLLREPRGQETRVSATEVPLHTADVHTGTITPLDDFADKSWLWYQHNLSHSLLSDVRGRWIAEQQQDLQALFRHGHVRSAAIVTA